MTLQASGQIHPGNLLARLSGHHLALAWERARHRRQLLSPILASEESDQRRNCRVEYIRTNLKRGERCPLRSRGNRKRLFCVQR